MRIVELGWAIGDIGRSDPLVKSYLIKPIGFTIANDATMLHRITNDMAASGRSLREVLEEFVTDVFQLCREGARLVSHHLEFDAGLLMNEFDCASLGHCKEEWSWFLRQGVCTMDLDIAHWVRQMLGIGDIPKYIPMRLLDMVNGFGLSTLPMRKAHHRARNDAIMHWFLCRELVKRTHQFQDMSRLIEVPLC